MRKLLTVGFILLVSCAGHEPYVGVVRNTLPTAVVIHVNVTYFELNISSSGAAVLEEKRATLTGAGVFITPNGHVLTCAHLFNFGTIKGIDVTDYYGNTLFGELLNMDGRRDLALLKINSTTPHYAVLADPRSLEVGQEVIAIGTPLGLDFSVTHGILSYINRDFERSYNVTQSDCFINPGNSGGPLFNMRGQLVGINSFLLAPVKGAVFTGLGFSVQPGQIIEFLTKFKGLGK